MAKTSTVARSKKTPKFSSRIVRRCFRCGRKRGYMREFDMCRICFRELANDGMITHIRSLPGKPMTDPIADFLTHIRNASAVNKPELAISYSKMKEEIANVLVKEGYLKSVAKKGKKINKTLEVGLAYGEYGPKVTGIERVSKLSKRVYKGARDLKSVKQGRGIW